MPLDRFFHPRLGHSRKIHDLSWIEKWVWVTYQLASDDFGVMRATVTAIQAADDSLADCKPTAVKHALKGLVDIGLVEAFEHQGFTYLCQLDWQDYQHIGYPRVTDRPKPSETILQRCSEKTRQLFGKHPGGLGKTSANVSETLDENLPSSRARETAKAKANGLRLTAEAPIAARGRKDVAYAGRPNVPALLHAELRSKLSGPDDESDRRLRDWYCETSDVWEGRDIGDDDWTFWRARFQEWIGTTRKTNTGREAKLSPEEMAKAVIRDLEAKAARRAVQS